MEEKKIFEKMKFLECSFEKINQTEELAFSCHFTELCINRFFDVCTALQKMAKKENCLPHYEESLQFWRVMSSHLHWMGFQYYRSVIPHMIKKATEQVGFGITWPCPLAVERRELDLGEDYEHLAEERTYYETAATAFILLQDAKKRLKHIIELETELVEDAFFQELNDGAVCRTLENMPSVMLPEDADIERKKTLSSVYDALLLVEADLKGILLEEA